MLAFSNYADSPQTFATNYSTPRDEYIITADTLTSTQVKLNGDLLSSADQLVPKHIPSGSTAIPITAPAYSAGFVVLPDAGAALCT